MKKLPMILTLITLIMIPVAIGFAGSNNRSDRASQDNSYIFSPGYVNAAKYQAESIKYQTNMPGSDKDKKDNFLDSAINYVKDKLGYNTHKEEQAQQNAPPPTLQQKTSSTNPTVISPEASGAVSTTVIVDPSKISAYILNKIVPYIESYDDLGSTNYKIKYSNGKYYAAWSNNSDSWDESAPCNIKAQVFDSNGEKIEGTETIILSKDDPDSPLKWVRLEDVTTLANGYIAVFWDEEDADTNYTCKVQTLDSNGNKTNTPTISLTGDSPAWYAETNNVTTLANGGMAVFWNEEDSDGNYSSNVQILDPSGSALVPPVVLENGESSELGIYVRDAVGLANGNIAVFTDEPNPDDPNGNWSIKVRLLDLNGNESGDPITLTGNSLEIDDLTGNGLVVDEYIDSITTLANGNIAVAVSQEDDSEDNNWFREKMVMFDSAGNKLDTPPITLAGDSGPRLLDVSVDQVALLANGNMAVFSEEEDSEGSRSSKVQILDSNGKRLTPPAPLTAGNGGYGTYIEEVFTLGNGKVAVFLSEADADDNFVCKIIMLDSEGNILDVPPVVLTGDTPLYNLWINNVTTLANGGMAVFWEGRSVDTGEHTFTSQALDNAGNFASPDLLNEPTFQTGPGILSINNTPLYNPFVNTFNFGGLNDMSTRYNMFNPVNLTGAGNSFDAVRSSLKNDSMLSQNMTGGGGQLSSEDVMRNALARLSFFTTLPAYLNASDAEKTSRLIGILNNPASDQKQVIDTVTSLLNDIENVQKETGDNSLELQKASDELLQAVANVLLAQAIPDLLKEGDLANLKGIFSNLDTAKSKIILEYKESTKPYYEEVKKMLEKNAAALDLNLKSILEKELRDMPRSEIDKIVEKLKAKEKRTFEEEYILQEEQKARATYLEPNKKRLEETMKAMLQEFTKRLSTTLGTTKK